MILADASGWGGTLFTGVLVLILAAVVFLRGRRYQRAKDVGVELERDRLKDEKDLRDKDAHELVDRARADGIIGGGIAADIRKHDDIRRHPGGFDDGDDSDGTGQGPSDRDGDPDR